MNNKQKIIIIISSVSLGGAILLPFLGKEDFSKKHNERYQVAKNNPSLSQSLSKIEKEEEEPLTTADILTISVIVIVILTVFISLYFRYHWYISSKIRYLFFIK